LVNDRNGTYTWSSYFQFTHISYYSDNKRPSPGVLTLTFTVSDENGVVAEIETNGVTVGIKEKSKKGGASSGNSVASSDVTTTVPTTVTSLASGTDSLTSGGTSFPVQAAPVALPPISDSDLGAAIQYNLKAFDNVTLSEIVVAIKKYREFVAQGDVVQVESYARKMSHPEVPVPDKAFQVATYLMGFGLCPKQHTETRRHKDFPITLMSFMSSVAHHMSAYEIQDDPAVLSAALYGLVVARAHKHGFYTSDDVSDAVTLIKAMLKRGQSLDAVAIPVVDWFIHPESGASACDDDEMKTSEREGEESKGESKEEEGKEGEKKELDEWEESIMALVTQMNSFCGITGQRKNKRDD
jgi:hypothetical protein